ncbi:MAG: trigger factor [Verrucomicrobiales bacterium]|nr:trigger factor [Verrucomicrobiales bacterium]
MNITLEKQDKCRVSARIEVPADTVNKERDEITASFASQAKVPGYRPGKIPLSMIRQRFAKGISEELSERLIRSGCQEAVKKEEGQILGLDKVEGATFQDDQSFTFTAELIIAPEFSLPDYKNLSVELPIVEVSDEEVDATLENLRQRFADFKDIEGPVAAGDFAIIDYKATLDGKNLSEAGFEVGALAQNEGFWVKVDEESFLPDFAMQLVGMKPEESKEVKITLKDDFDLEDLQGKELVYTVKLNKIQQQELPEMDDALAEKIQPGKTLAEIRELISENMKGEKENRRKDSMTNQILEQLTKDLDFDLPEHLVQGETQRMVNTMVQQGQQNGIDDNAIMEQQEQILDTAATQGRSNVKTTFVLEKIAEEENIEASEDDIRHHVAMMASQTGRPVKKLVRELRDSNGFDNIKHQITIGRTLDFLRDKVSVIDVKEEKATAEESS